MKIIVSSAFGTEASVKRELEKLGIEKPRAFSGKFVVEGDFELLMKLCIWLRCADRVFIELAEFKASTFDELYENTSQIDFSKFLKKYTKVYLDGSCSASKLMAIKACGGVIKKAIMNSLENAYNTTSETGELVVIYFSIVNDWCKILIDACGDGLHKRGYRAITYSAPLKETLACSLIDLSIYSPKKLLCDPFCGSGTIAIEAAMIARNIAPGLKRHFDFEKLVPFSKPTFEKLKREATCLENDIIPKIFASDISEEAILLARENAKKAGVEKYIEFKQLDMRDFYLEEEYGVLICNPPYGDRLSNKDEVKKIYSDFGKVFSSLKNWSCYVLTDCKDLEKLFKRKADKKRKLFNAKIECTYYTFLGKKPEK